MMKALFSKMYELGTFHLSFQQFFPIFSSTVALKPIRVKSDKVDTIKYQGQ